MSLVQLITPNPNIPCKPGWCLEYVAKAFGVFGQGIGQPSATAAWQFALTKGTAHTDRNFDGLWVPVYFTFIGEPNGHIVVKAPDNSVYSSSSPTSTTPVHHTSIETLNQYYGGKLGLLGWSEDLNGIKIVKEENMVTIEQVVYNDLVQWKKDGMVLAERVKVLTALVKTLSDQRTVLTKSVADITAKLTAANDEIEGLNTIIENIEIGLRDANAEIARLKALPPKVEIKEVIKYVDKIIVKEVPMGFDQLSLGELLSEAFKKLFKIK